MSGVFFMCVDWHYCVMDDCVSCNTRDSECMLRLIGALLPDVVLRVILVQELSERSN